MEIKVDLSEDDIKVVYDYGKRKGITDFTESIRSIIKLVDGAPSLEGDDISDNNFALIADALFQMNENIINRLDSIDDKTNKLRSIENIIGNLSSNMAPPSSPGEVKKI